MNICRILIQLRRMWPSVTAVAELTRNHWVADTFFAKPCSNLLNEAQEEKLFKGAAEGPVLSSFCHNLLTLANSYYYFLPGKNKRRYLYIMSKLLCSIQRKWIVIYTVKLWEVLKSIIQVKYTNDRHYILSLLMKIMRTRWNWSHLLKISVSDVKPALTCTKAVFVLLKTSSNDIWEYVWSITRYILVPRHTKLFYC